MGPLTPQPAAALVRTAQANSLVTASSAPDRGVGSPANPKTPESSVPIPQTPHPDPSRKTERYQESNQPNDNHATTASARAINHSGAGALGLKNDDDPRNESQLRSWSNNREESNADREEEYLAAPISSLTQSLRERRRHRR